MNATETLRSRFRPDWRERTDMVGLHGMLETALSFFAAPAAKRAKLAEPGTLSERGLAESLRKDLGTNVVPELRRIRKTVDERRAAIGEERKALARPRIDTADVAAAMLRQEMRAYLRELSSGDRMAALIDNADPTMLTAALEAPPLLSGLTATTRDHVVQAYLETTHGGLLRAMEERREALDVVGAAAELAINAMRPYVGLDPHQFEPWFATAA